MRAFTLVELLVTIAIIAVLLSLVLAAFGPFRAAANQTDSLSALRQMAMGFNAYTTDNAGRLMPGYLADAQLDSSNPQYLGITARGRHGQTIPPEALNSYVWRLSPYLEHAWNTMLKDYKEEDILSKAGEAVTAEIYLREDSGFDPGSHFSVAEQPSFGMNSIYVGGDAVHGGPEVTEFSPWNTAGNPSIAATRMSQINSPARLIVFGSVARANADGASGETAYASEAQLGVPELRAPYTVYNSDSSATDVKFENQQWTLGDGKQVVLGVDADFGGDDDIGGVPVMRWSKDQLPVAKVDGSTAGIEIGVLAGDMRHWAWQATGLSAPRTNPPPN